MTPLSGLKAAAVTAISHTVAAERHNGVAVHLFCVCARVCLCVCV